MENSLSSAIQKMGGNFLVAAFVPAMGFIIATTLTFNNYLPPQLKCTNTNGACLIQSTLYLLLLTTVLGFTLFSLSTFIYKSFEGYTFLLGIDTPLGRSSLRRQIKRFQKNQSDGQLVEKQITRIQLKIIQEQNRQASSYRTRNAQRIKRYHEKIKSLRDRQYSIASEKNEYFPPEQGYVLPTRFGNILRASEMYAGARYRIDSVPLWGRLAHVIPPEGMEKIDQANNQCLFLLNGSVLASIYTVICLLASLYGLIKLQQGETSNLSSIHYDLIWVYLILGILSGAIAWLFYIASLYNVSQYGNMIRTAYDLYRFNLIEALHLRLPKNLKDERWLWRRISYFTVGNNQLELIKQLEGLEKDDDPIDADFKYTHPKKIK
jgi:hypothetical protein